MRSSTPSLPLRHMRRTSWSTAIQLCVVIVLLLFVTVLIMRCMVRLTARPSAAREAFANPSGHPGITRHDPNAPEPITDVSADMLATYASDHRSTPATIYDDKYTKLYRRIVDEPKAKLVEFEVEDLQQRTKLKEYGSKAIVVDVGCGTGVHLDLLATELPDAQLYGIDLSPDMLSAARQRLRPHGGRVRLMEGDLNDREALYEGMCTHLVCYYFSFNYAKSSRTFFENARRWLQPNGYVCVHLVDPHKFDPVPEVANPVRGISLQRYFTKRKTDAKIILNRSHNGADGVSVSHRSRNRIYKCNFEHKPKTRSAVFTEEIIDPAARHVRRHTTTLHMPHHEAVVQAARKAGFRLRHVTPLLEIGDEYEYLCYLQRDDAEV